MGFENGFSNIRRVRANARVNISNRFGKPFGWRLAGRILLCVMLFSTGCAQVVVPGTLAGAGEYYRYSTGNVAQQTVNGDLDRVSDGTQAALQKMKIRLEGVSRTDDETVFHAETPQLDIQIRLKPITPAVTKVTVDATKGRMIKDKSTAEEILSQIRHAVGTAPPLPPTGRPIAVFVRNDCSHPIRVAVYYLNGGKDAENWETRGWYFFEPGQRRQVVTTRNQYIYFYAESRKEDRLNWTGTHYQELTGRRYGFFKVDMGKQPDDFTQAFTCRP